MVNILALLAFKNKLYMGARLKIYSIIKFLVRFYVSWWCVLVAGAGRGALPSTNSFSSLPLKKKKNSIIFSSLSAIYCFILISLCCSMSKTLLSASIILLLDGLIRSGF
jgi:hypothetical protein